MNSFEEEARNFGERLKHEHQHFDLQLENQRLAQRLNEVAVVVNKLNEELAQTKWRLASLEKKVSGK